MRARSIFVMSALAVGLASAQGCTAARRPVGLQCRFNDDCVDPLVCAGSSCRAQCHSDRDCTNGYQCLASGQPDKSVCVPPEAPRPCLYTSDCPVPLVCHVDGQCGTQCVNDWDCRDYNSALSCDTEAGVCFEPGADAGVAEGG